MRQTKRNVFDRILATFMALLIVAALPINALAAAAAPSAVETDIQKKTFTVGEETEFLVNTAAKDNAGKMVVTAFTFSMPDAVESLQYKDRTDGSWKDIPRETWEAPAAELVDGETAYRVVFNKSGEQTVTVELKAAEGQKEIYAKTEAKITVNESQENKVTVSVNPYTGGTVSLNKTAVDPTKGITQQVSENAAVSVDIKAEAGYVIESVLFGQEQQQVDEPKQEFHGTLDVAKVKADTIIDVKFAPVGKVVTISAPASDGGKIELNGQKVDKLTVTKGSDVTAAITADDGYQIKSVVIGGKQQELKEPAKFTYTLEKIETDTEIQVVFVKVHIVKATNNNTAGGSVMLNQQSGESLTVEQGSEVEVAVKANTGYQIKSITVNGAAQEVKDKGEFQFTLKSVNEKTDIIVDFAKVFTVTVTCNQDGSVQLDPSGKEGKVTVEANTKVSITATPNNGYRVSEVLVNGKAQKVSGENGSGYNTELTANEDYTVQVTFSENEYLISAEETKKGKVTVETPKVAHGKSVKVTLLPDDGYTVDTVTVSDQSDSNQVDIIKDESGIYFTIENVTADKSVAVTFKETARGQKSDFSIKEGTFLREYDTESSKETVYVVKIGQQLEFTTEKNGIRVYDDKGKVIGGGETEQTVHANGTIGKIEVYYQAENEHYKDWHIVEIKPIKTVEDGDGIVADMNMAEPNKDGYYNDNVTIDVSAKDTQMPSGLKTVEYWITKDGEKGKAVTLYQYADDGNILDEYEKKGAIVVDASVYNSDNVVVTLHVVDRADNEKEIPKPLKINSTDPTMKLELSGKQKEDAVDHYYAEERTLTITITDRKDTFAKEGFQFIVNDKNIASEIVWQDHVDGDNPNEHIGRYEFVKNGTYDWSIAYTNKAGKAAKTEGVSDNIYHFSIDKIIPTNPQISYSKKLGDLTIEALTFGFYKAPVTVKIQAEDTGENIEKFVYSYITEDDKPIDNVKTTVERKDIEYRKNVFSSTVTASYSFTLLPENVEKFRGKVTFTATDKAGNTVSPQDNNHVVVVDHEQPEISVRYDQEKGRNSNLYNHGRCANITIKEDNFFRQDLDDKLLVIKVTMKRPNDLIGKAAYLTPEFVSQGNIHTAEIDFTEDADYTFEITYKDRAGNPAKENYYEKFTIDQTPPAIEVTYEDGGSADQVFYNHDRTAIISVKEANFSQNDVTDGLLSIKVKKTLNDGTSMETNEKPIFIKDGDAYIGRVTFKEDAKYIMEVNYTDRAGTQTATPYRGEFIIDKTPPKIIVSYDNNSCKNNDQFKKERVATIQVIDHYFDSENVHANITENGEVAGAYSDYLGNPDNWQHNEDVHTAHIRFTNEAHYTFKIQYKDLADNPDEGVDFGESVAPAVFTLDKTAPTGHSIMIDNVSVLGEGSIDFDTFYREEVVVELGADCDISGLESLKYQKLSKASDYDEYGTWTDYDPDNGITIAPSEKSIIYLRAEDRAGNVSIAHSTGIIVDDRKPSGETDAPEIDIIPQKPNANGMHNGNVQVDLKVVDPRYAGSEASEDGYHSGLNKITYRIYTTDTDAQEQGTLFDSTGSDTGAEYDEDNLASSWSGRIEVNAAKFNSNHVYVEVTAVDNAGNVRTSTSSAGEIMIDVTAPRIDVSYDNNSDVSDGCFNTGRTATIVVTDRNFTPEGITLTLTNADGIVPKLSGWTKIEGSGNMDNTKWVATIEYTTDGDYEFGISCTDLAGWTCDKNSVNYGTSVAPTSFTIDMTRPVVTVSYDNNSAANTNYYNATRVATIVIDEHNLDPNGADRDRITITMTASDDGTEKTVPAVSEWHTVGDKHTATVRYSEDGLYTFYIEVKDKAGNAAVDFEEQTFYIDKTLPSLKITGVADNSANNGDVIPVVTYSDTNYDADQVTITLTGANRKNVTLDGFYADIHNGGVFTFNNFARDKKNDDVYTLTATLTDKAGNTSTDAIMFSVNRFGSIYSLSDSTEKLNGTYVKKPIDLVITETNANKLSNIKVTLFKNNKATILKEGADYKISIDGGEGKWYRYTYTIFAKVFDADGVYKVTIESTDEAGNDAKNNQDTKNTEINFGVDQTSPIVNIANLQSNTTYATDNWTVNMSVMDNLKLAKVIVELDGREFKVWKSAELEEIVKNGGNFSFDILGDSNDAHNLVVYAVDEAGNGEKVSEIELPENAEVVEDFYVTTNLWVRFYTNKPVFYGTIAVVILLVGALVAFPLYRKKKAVVKR